MPEPTPYLSQCLGERTRVRVVSVENRMAIILKKKGGISDDISCTMQHTTKQCDLDIRKSDKSLFLKVSIHGDGYHLRKPTFRTKLLVETKKPQQGRAGGRFKNVITKQNGGGGAHFLDASPKGMGMN